MMPGPPPEITENPESDNAFQDISQTFQHFFARKVMFVKFAAAYVVMPGGYGTLDELCHNSQHAPRLAR